MKKSNDNGQTPLIEATGGGDERTVKILLDHSVQLEAVSRNRSAPLLVASREGSEAFIRLLLDKGANIEAKRNTQLTALLLATLNRHHKAVELLLDRGADVLARGNYKGDNINSLDLAMDSRESVMITRLLRDRMGLGSHEQYRSQRKKLSLVRNDSPVRSAREPAPKTAHLIVTGASLCCSNSL